MTSRTSFSPEKLRSYLGMALAVAAGGALGALLRWALSTGWTSAPGTIDWAVLLINVVGSALLGVVTVVAARRLSHRPALVAFLGTGLLGGFTTFSTVMVLSLQLANDGHPWLASLQVFLNLVLAVLAAVVAMFCTTLAIDKQDAKRGLPTELTVDPEESAVPMGDAATDEVPQDSEPAPRRETERLTASTPFNDTSGAVDRLAAAEDLDAGAVYETVVSDDVPTPPAPRRETVPRSEAVPRRETVAITAELVVDTTADTMADTTADTTAEPAAEGT